MYNSYLERKWHIAIAVDNKSCRSTLDTSADYSSPHGKLAEDHSIAIHSKVDGVCTACNYNNPLNCIFRYLFNIIIIYNLIEK